MGCIEALYDIGPERFGLVLSWLGEKLRSDLLAFMSKLPPNSALLNPLPEGLDRALCEWAKDNASAKPPSNTPADKPADDSRESASD